MSPHARSATHSSSSASTVIVTWAWTRCGAPWCSGLSLRPLFFDLHACAAPPCTPAPCLPRSSCRRRCQRLRTCLRVAAPSSLSVRRSPAGRPCRPSASARTTGSPASGMPAPVRPAAPPWPCFLAQRLSSACSLPARIRNRQQWPRGPRCLLPAERQHRSKDEMMMTDPPLRGGSP